MPCKAEAASSCVHPKPKSEEEFIISAKEVYREKQRKCDTGITLSFQSYTMYYVCRAIVSLLIVTQFWEYNEFVLFIKSVLVNFFMVSF